MNIYMCKSLPEYLEYFPQFDQINFLAKVEEGSIISVDELLKQKKYQVILEPVKSNKNHSRYLNLLIAGHINKRPSSHLFQQLLDLKKEMKDSYQIELKVVGDMKIFTLCSLALLKFKELENTNGWVHFKNVCQPIFSWEQAELFNSIPIDFFTTDIYIPSLGLSMRDEQLVFE